ncbi:SDR family oxidoreductase [Limosilactobacillus oris]|uniref:SDR family oxidoreductase n=1 Tax=Limosilactobacillus oris TaxID=1632 RepID=UPI00188435F0|nr:SDR family oxidoreductase [Limosilactobacillus oris]MBF0600300.1 SDR family oxidoreductase [Limosilactobacillus oris]
MSKVFVAGGSGRVATDLIKDLVADGHQVIAGARHPEKIVQLAGVTPVTLDLHGDVAKIASLMAGADAVYFVAGSRGKDLLQTDAMGAVKTMQAAERAGIKRYIMLSSMYALQPEKWADYPALAAITDYNIAKFFADNYLIHNTDLNYTIVQPATLTEEPATGRVTFGEGDDTTNPIPDVAQVLATVLANDNTIGKVIMMRSGDTPIDTAVKEV